MNKRLALIATTHCLTGCAIGETLGMIAGSVFGWGVFQTVAAAVFLAFLFGYSLTLLPLLNSGLGFLKAASVALASDTLSITIMEIVDNLIILLIPGAIDAAINSLLFWGSLIISLVFAFIAAYPVNLYLISKGKGHSHH